jgi:hypothetical protein
MALALIYDQRYHTFESWSSLMVEAYAGQQLQIGVPEAQWKDWAVGLMAIDLFQNNALPSPNLFEDWRDWVDSIRNAVNQKV